MSSNAPHNIDEFESLLVTLQNTFGLVVPDEQRNSLLGRMAPILSSYKLESFSLLADNLEDSRSKEIRSVVLDAVSKTQLAWSLSSEFKDILNNYIFSQLTNSARVWIIGCGQGQFAYAIAMEAAKYKYKNDSDIGLEFIATDVSATDIKQAESGVYSKQQITGLSEEYKKLFVSSMDQSDNVQVKEKIRQQISFSRCNLTEDFQSLGKMDLIICPEALAYFSNETKATIVQQCSDLLKSGGIFLTGNTHIFVPTDGSLERVEHSAGIFYRQKS